MTKQTYPRGQFDLIQRRFRPQVRQVGDGPEEMPSGVAGKVLGMACPYNTVDFMGTMFSPGCFDRTRAEKVPQGKVPLFRDHQHDTRDHVGVVRDCPDVGGGMMMHADCYDTDEGRSALEYCKSVLAADGFTGLSVGVYVRSAEWRPNPSAIRDGVPGNGSGPLTTDPGSNPSDPGIGQPATREAKTKRVDGEDLSAEDFIIVGDKDDTSTWKLPWHFSSDEKTKSHLRNALARFNQMTGISAETKKAAKSKLKRLCKEHGIEVSDDFSMDERDGGASDAPQEVYTFTECELAEISLTPMPAVPGAELLHARAQRPVDYVRGQLVALRALLVTVPRHELLAVLAEFSLGDLKYAVGDGNGSAPSDAAIRAAATSAKAVPLDERLRLAREFAVAFHKH